MTENERLTNSDKEIPTLNDNAEYWLQVYFKLKDYEEIGTIEECRTAVERMKPKKVTYQGEHEKCPSCGSFHVFGKHCTECGQAVDYD